MTSRSIPLHKSISFKLAKNTVAVALVLGMLLTSAQIYLDYFNEQQKSKDSVKRALATASQSASFAAYNLDEDASVQIIRGLSSNPSIVNASILDNFGGYLGQTKNYSDEQPAWISRQLFGQAKTVTTPLYVEGEGLVGTLVLEVDPALNAQSFLERSGLAMLSGIVRNFILAICIMVVFYWGLARSLKGASVRIGEQESLNALDIPQAHKEDELGVLFTEFNRHIGLIRQQHQQIQDANVDLEAQVSRRTEQLHQQNKELIEQRVVAETASRAKTDFLAVMSHEVRTPMNGILGIGQLLGKTTLDSRQQEYVDAINESSLALLGLMNDALDFSRGERGQLRFENVRFNLKNLLNSVVFLMSPAAEQNNCSLSVVFEGQLPQGLIGDAPKFRQVLINLLANAIKFTKDGEITLLVQLDSNTEKGINLRFIVTDTGIGINEEARSSIFTPYSQADASIQQRFGGSGMGLAICKAVVEGQGGHIGFSSELGRGSSFWFALLFQPTTTDSIPELEQMNEVAVEIKRILVVDDVETNLKLAKWALEFEGHWVETAASGDSALDLFQIHSFDLILMDINMPGMNGIEASEQLRNQGFTGLIYGVTAYVSYDLQSRCETAGMNKLLQKPLSYPQLVSNSETLLEQFASIDGQQFERHQQQLGVEKSMALYQMAFDQLASLLGDLQQAAENRDLHSIESLCHKCAGLCGNFGFQHLAALLLAIEQQCQHGFPQLDFVKIERYKNQLHQQLSNLR